MNDIDAIKAKIEKAKDRLSKLHSDLKKAILDSQIRCFHCNEESKIRNVPAISGLSYSNEAYSEHWYESKQFIVCPLCGNTCSVSYDQYNRRNEIKITKELWYEFPVKFEAYLPGQNGLNDLEKATKQAIEWINRKK